MDDVSDASFLGKLLVLPANVILDWKMIPRYKHSSLFGLVFCYEENKFYNIDTWPEKKLQNLEEKRTFSRELRYVSFESKMALV